ncbi:nuclear factor related to kappa-B-binding protein isoform X2 [Aricia agestis]|uniref:nuclear factor related to kappa-B-binding protein isoform X2 n=1 Tax=Aricia agestis TaxID=91739 RepID=UPI001C205E35|nr:nuclear factor related to kappa-B-binding protein isoform X2 [Aricia agestis]
MEEKMDSENSYSHSGDSSSSSDSSSGSSECDEEVTEAVRILGQTLELPQDLCEDYSVFREFFSMKTWESLDDKHKEYLRTLLPQFKEDDEEEKDTTLDMLFNCEPFHFSSPLDIFFNNLRQGNYRPDIARMRKFLMKARAKQQKHKIKSYYAKILPEVLISRERLLAVAKAVPPGPTPYIPSIPPKPSAKNNYKPIYVRARQRYFDELSAIWSEVGCDESEDENYPEGAPENTAKKRKLNSGQNMETVSGTLGALDSAHPSSIACLKSVLATHRARRQYKENHPELNTTGITLEEIKQRVSLMNGTKKLMFGGQKVETPIHKIKKVAKGGNQKLKDLKSAIKKVKEEDNADKTPLLPNIKIKSEPDASDSEHSSVLDPVSSPKQKKILDQSEIKQEVSDSKFLGDSDLDRPIKEEPQDCMVPNPFNSKICQPVPIKLEDLDGIDMMALPVELVDESGDVMAVNKPEVKSEPTIEDEALTETTHANFLSLVRALFPARAAHRASKQQLHARCAAVMRSPIAPLNTWYNLSDDWCGELNSALEFLAGDRGPHPDDYVPYLQYIPSTQMYQWIGAGRDCDAILGRLCERWLRAASPTPASREPPPSRHPTNWVVRQPTNAEIAEFRAQERRRFSTPSKPFTYVLFGYRSSVGAVGGARGGAAGSRASGAGAALVSPQRPRAVAFVPLLRDAVARLPNGEGTTRHVVTLLKMSQWIVPCSEQVLTTAVTNVLEKLAAVKRDPFVKYDQRTSIWTYLHRHKSEEDWLKSTARSRANKSNSVSSTPSVQTPMDVDVSNPEEVLENASDSDVDVDDTSAPTSTAHLSSAQLLMQATQATSTPVHITKTKGKLIPTAKPKATPQKPQPKMPSLVQTKTSPQVKPVSQANTVQSPKPTQTQPKQASLLQSPKSNPTPPKPAPKTVPTKSIVKPSIQSPKQAPKQNIVVQGVKQNVTSLAKQISESLITQMSTTLPSIVIAPQRSPLTKQKSVSKIETPQSTVSTITSAQQNAAVASILQSNITTTLHQTTTSATKLTPVTRSLLIRPSAVQTTTTSVVNVVTTPAQVPSTPRRSVVRVLSPATPSSGKSLISPRALLHQSTPATKKRTLPSSVSESIIVQTTATASSTSTEVSLSGTSVATSRTVHLGPQLQLSSLSQLQQIQQLVRLPSGQTVQLASPHTLQALKVTPQKTQPRPLTKSVLPSTVQIAGQTVQIGGQTVQLAGQTVQLGHTVKLPGGQSVQVASPSLSSSVQLPSGQTVQIGGNVQTVQLGQNVQLSGQNMGQTVQLSGQNMGQTVQLSGQNMGQTVQLTGQNVGQTVQLSSQNMGQTVQLSSQNMGQSVQLSSQNMGQTVQLSSQSMGQTVQIGGQTVQLPSGQTIQLANGQTLQLANGQTIQLANQTPKSVSQVVRAPGDKSVQPIMAKLLSNAQTQMISLDSGGAAGRARGVRVLAPARPVLLAAGKPLQNIILQQSDGTAIRVTSSGGTATSQTLVLSNIGGQGVATSTSSAPVLKLQQAVSSAGTGVRSVLMDGQQLKLVGGRHVLARLLRPAAPQPPQ